MQHWRLRQRVHRLKQNALYRQARAMAYPLRPLLNALRGIVRHITRSGTLSVNIRATGTHHVESRGSEVWLLDVVAAQSVSTPSWNTISETSGWQVTPAEQSYQGQALVAAEATTLRLHVPQQAALRVLRHPWSGIVEINAQGETHQIDLFAPQTDVIEIPLGRELVVQSTTKHAPVVSNISVSAPWTEEEQLWIRTIHKHQPAAIGIMHPKWRGVRTCMEHLLSYHLLLEDDLDAAKAERVARMILESGCTRVMLGGFPLTYTYLVHALKRLAPHIHIYPFWLGTFLQTSEDYAWQGFQQIDQLCRDGLITKWGFAKHGMAEVVGTTGVPTGFVMSYVRTIPDGPSQPTPGGPHLGIWAVEQVWRKPPYAMLAAAALIPHAQVVGRGQNTRVREFAEFFRLNATLHDDPLPHEAMAAALAQMHLNLYVTLSECTPMLPLESLAAGAPCLIGPTSHLFEDHPYLHSRLIVPSPDRAFVIAQYIEQALAERDQIVLAYKVYAPEYNARAQASLRAFLEVDDDAVL